MEKVVLATLMLVVALFVGCVFEPYGDQEGYDGGGFHRQDAGDHGNFDHEERR
jgi:hypothetical protein